MRRCDSAWLRFRERVVVHGLRAELLAFPAGKHDDQVDALRLVEQLLDKMLVGHKARPTEKPTARDRYASARWG
jgi:hypothetical protein